MRRLHGALALLVASVAVAGASSGVSIRPVGTGLGGSRSFMDLTGPKSGVDSLSRGEATRANYVIPYRTLGRLTRPQLAFVNQYFSNFHEKPGPNPIQVRATIEAGRSFPVTTGGQRQWTVAPGARVVTDPQRAVDIPSGTGYRIRVEVQVAHAGEKWPLGRPALASGVTPYAPSEILAPASLPSVAIFGDSIAHGYDNTARDGGYYGGIERALAGRAGYVTIATDSETAQNFAIASNVRLRMASLQGVQYAVGMLGRNDLTPNIRSAAQIERDLVTIWHEFAARGIEVYACTVLPATTSKDSWATTRNQRPYPSEPKRVALNDWIRAGAPIDPHTRMPVAPGTPGALVAGTKGHPLTGWFDTARAVETAKDSGLWKADGTPHRYTLAGIHPTAAGYALMSKAIDPAVFRATPGHTGGGSSGTPYLVAIAIALVALLAAIVVREIRRAYVGRI